LQDLGLVQKSEIDVLGKRINMHFVQKALVVAGFGLSLGLLATSVLASPANPVAGAEYMALASPQPTSATIGKKVEVTEFFWYSCPHCSALEPSLEDWVAKQGDKIYFQRVPISSDPRMVPQQKLFYALEALGKVTEMQKKVFNAIHVQHQRLDNDASIADFIAKQGIDKAKFMDLYNSFSVQTKVARAVQLQNAYKVEGVPMLVVDGRFVTSPAIVQASPGAGDTEAALFKSTMQVMDGLVAKAAIEKNGTAVAANSKK
jgi:protein dithiol oxidoreductase (disulfide-forming)